MMYDGVLWRGGGGACCMSNLKRNTMFPGLTNVNIVRSKIRLYVITYQPQELPRTASLNFLVMSIRSVSHVDLKKCSRCRFEFKGRGHL